MFLQNKRLELRPLRPDDAQSNYVNWLNDKETCRGNSHHVFPYTPEQAEQYIKGMVGSQNNIVLAIVVRDSGLHIGNISLQNIHYVNRSAEFAILIGEKSARASGYGTDAASLIIEHGFKTLNLERIHCGTYSTNLGMKRLAEHLGMTEVGILRKAAFKDGQYLDVVLFDLLRSEWNS